VLHSKAVCLKLVDQNSCRRCIDDYCEEQNFCCACDCTYPKRAQWWSATWTGGTCWSM